MPETRISDFLAILRVMVAAQVDFLVIGGVGAVLQGVPIVTFDLDLVHSRRPDNIPRVLAALEELDAYYRIQPERRLKPGVSHLSSPGHQSLVTRYGPLDLLGSVIGGGAYDDLLPHTFELQLEPGLTVRVLELASLIAMKEQVGGEKDLATLPVLRRTLEEKRRA